MADEVSTTTETKSTSDGRVDISVEKYNELTQLANRPQVINQTVTKVEKTPEMLAEEKQLWGGSLMGLGASMFAVGMGLFKSGRLK